MLDFFSFIVDLFELSCIYVGIAGEAAEIELVGERTFVGARNRTVNMLERHLRDPLGPIKRDDIATHVGDAIEQASSMPREIQRGIQRETLANSRIAQKHAGRQITGQLNTLNARHKRRIARIELDLCPLSPVNEETVSPQIIRNLPDVRDIRHWLQNLTVDQLPDIRSAQVHMDHFL